MEALNPISVRQAGGANPTAGGGASPTPGAGPAPTTDLFLQLLIAQMRSQNPLEPQKGTEFITQLAQFNTMEQLIAIRAELTAIRRSAEAAGNTQPNPRAVPTLAGPLSAPALDEAGPTQAPRLGGTSWNGPQ